jgi:Kef-type K+ transport system membrane component KefB
VALTWGIGLILGLVAVLLIGRGLTRDEIWGVVVGTLLLATGVAAELGLSGISAAFSLGLTLGCLSSRRSELVRMLRPTESAVLLPLAVLAGALVNLREAPALWLLIPLGLGARFLVELVRGALLALCSKAARPAGPLVGLGMMAMGEMTLACAVAIGLSFHSPAAKSVLALAVVAVLAGELLGPLTLRRALSRAGELDAGVPEPARLSLDPEGTEA